MKNKDISQMTDQELLKNDKTLKGIVPALGALLLLLFCSSLFLSFKKGFSALTAVPIALLPILILCIRNQKETKQEILKRNL
jgi:hypothetical protein